MTKAPHERAQIIVGNQVFSFTFSMEFLSVKGKLYLMTDEVDRIPRGGARVGSGGPEGIRTPDCALGKRRYIRFNYGTVKKLLEYSCLKLCTQFFNTDV